VRQALRTQLPEHQVPAAVVVLEALPRTATGKMDRRALPAPGLPERPWTPPRTPMETTLAEIWAEVLGVPRVGRDDHFFDLGGHSLRAAQVAARVRQRFGIEFTLRALFDGASLADIAQQIQVKLEQTTRESSPDGEIAPIPRTGRLHLSYAQERLWFLSELHPEGGAYNVPLAIELRGPLNARALESSIEALVARHEALRTVFAVDHEGPHQVVLPPSRFHLPILDLANPPELQDAQLKRLLAEQASSAFDLYTGPLLRAHLARCSAERHVLVLTIHHIATDGWSEGIILRELSTHYTAIVEGRPATVEPLRIQYADYAAWQRGLIEGPVGSRQLAYWRERLNGAPSRIDLPTDRARPSGRSFDGARLPLQIDPQVTTGLRQLARETNTTMFMVCLSAVQILLARYARQSDVVVGTLVAGRKHADLEGQIGFFVNTLPLRLTISRNLSFRDLLAGQTRETVLAAFAHEDVPFERLVQEVQPERNLSVNPIFQASVAFQNAPYAEIALPGIIATVLELPKTYSKFDLTFHLWETDRSLEGALIYSRVLFDQSTAQRFITSLYQVLSRVAANPDVRVFDIPLLSSHDRAVTLSRCRGLVRHHEDATLVHDVLSLNATATPAAPALLCDEDELSWQDLNCRANQLAHCLQARGVGPDRRVALWLERSAEAVVALWAVLKAGGAYVPIDGDCPPRRAADLIRASGAMLILTRTRLAALLPWSNTPMLCLDAERATVASAPTTNPATQTRAANLAYVLFTSGSTGEAKGVLVEHRQLTNYGRGLVEALGIGPARSFVLLQPLGFDSGLSVIMGAAMTAGCLHVLSEEAGLDPLAVSAHFAKHRVDCLKIVPSHLAALLRGARETGWPGRLLPREYLLLGGEAADPAWVQWLQELAPKCRIFNHYGPTEATVGVAVHQYRPSGAQPAMAVLPLEHGLRNTHLTVLDEHLEPQPDGVIGEIYIGGAGVARGYLDQPRLAAEHFLPDPYAVIPGGRMYRTGDLARWRPGGLVEFLGRKDRQVKVRGCRVELGEIEHALRTLPGVAEAVVCQAADAVELVGVVRPSAARVGSVHEIRQQLLERLPTYMVPPQIHVVESLPYTARGKLDHAAIQRMIAASRQSEPTVPEGSVPAHTPVERCVLEVWSEVLPGRSVALDQNFFAIGGHSLLAVQIASRLRARLGISMPLRLVFERPVARDLATELAGLVQHASEQATDGSARVKTTP
jgi:amino acid adenylation domain-containing protein